MISIEHEYEIEWDYIGYNNIDSFKYNPWTQKDWNQTLYTEINRISAQIHAASMRGGGNVIRCNTKLMTKLLSDLEYFDKNNKVLANRYKCEVDDLIFDDVIYVYTNTLIELPLLIPNVDGGEVTFKIIKDYGESYEFKKKLIGKIKILNYGE